LDSSKLEVLTYTTASMLVSLVESDYTSFNNCFLSTFKLEDK
jgi:hypothetical protein